MNMDQHSQGRDLKPVYYLLLPSGVLSRPQARMSSGIDVAVVKMDQLVNWYRMASLYMPACNF